MATKRPTEQDQREALRRFLSGLAEGADVFELAESVKDLHPKNNTFPGEVFMALAADALELANVTRGHPIRYDGLREAYLPECRFRGRENRKIQYALLTSASLRGGLEPDLLDEGLASSEVPFDTWKLGAVRSTMDGTSRLISRSVEPDG
jgi:hypothetical protein